LAGALDSYLSRAAQPAQTALSAPSDVLITQAENENGVTIQILVNKARQ
jgi:hypothetical protein